MSVLFHLLPWGSLVISLFTIRYARGFEFQNVLSSETPPGARTTEGKGQVRDTVSVAHHDLELVSSHVHVVAHVDVGVHLYLVLREQARGFQLKSIINWYQLPIAKSSKVLSWSYQLDFLYVCFHRYIFSPPYQFVS